MVVLGLNILFGRELQFIHSLEKYFTVCLWVGYHAMYEDYKNQ